MAPETRLEKAKGSRPMPRYLVQRTFPEGWTIDADERRGICEANRAHGVTWLHSNVSADGTVSYCVYEAPSAAAVRLAGHCAGLTIDLITEVRVLDPYAFAVRERDEQPAGGG